MDSPTNQQRLWSDASLTLDVPEWLLWRWLHPVPRLGCSAGEGPCGVVWGGSPGWPWRPPWGGSEGSAGGGWGFQADGPLPSPFCLLLVYLPVCWGAGVSCPLSGEPQMLSGPSPLVQRAKTREEDLEVTPLRFFWKLKNGFFTGMVAQRALYPRSCEIHSKYSWEVFRKHYIHTALGQKMPVCAVRTELWPRARKPPRRPRRCLQMGHARHCRLSLGPHMDLGLRSRSRYEKKLARDELQPDTPKQKQELLAAWRYSGPLGVVGEFCQGLYRAHQRPEQHGCLWETLPLHTPSGRASGLQHRPPWSSLSMWLLLSWCLCLCSQSLHPQQNVCFAALKLQLLPQYTPGCPRATEDSPISSQPVEPEGWPAVFWGKSSYGTAAPLPQLLELDAAI